VTSDRRLAGFGKHVRQARQLACRPRRHTRHNRGGHRAVLSGCRSVLAPRRIIDGSHRQPNITIMAELTTTMGRLRHVAECHEPQFKVYRQKENQRNDGWGEVGWTEAGRG
jgi:hypothetical protein